MFDYYIEFCEESNINNATITEANFLRNERKLSKKKKQNTSVLWSKIALDSNYFEFISNFTTTTGSFL